MYVHTVPPSRLGIAEITSAFILILLVCSLLVHCSWLACACACACVSERAVKQTYRMSLTSFAQAGRKRIQRVHTQRAVITEEQSVFCLFRIGIYHK